MSTRLRFPGKRPFSLPRRQRIGLWCILRVNAASAKSTAPCLNSRGFWVPLLLGYGRETHSISPSCAGSGGSVGRDFCLHQGIDGRGRSCSDPQGPIVFCIFVRYRETNPSYGPCSCSLPPFDAGLFLQPGQRGFTSGNRVHLLDEAAGHGGMPGAENHQGR